MLAQTFLNLRLFIRKMKMESLQQQTNRVLQSRKFIVLCEGAKGAKRERTCNYMKINDL